jgi:hypothetical protein
LALTSLTSGGRSVGIVRLRTTSYGVTVYTSYKKSKKQYYGFLNTLDKKIRSFIIVESNEYDKHYKNKWLF